MSDAETIAGLSSPAVEELRQKHGFNEVKTKPVPEWKKLARRYTDWISIIIVRTSVVDLIGRAQHVFLINSVHFCRADRCGYHLGCCTQ